MSRFWIPEILGYRIQNLESKKSLKFWILEPRTKIHKIIPGANFIFSRIDEEIECYFNDKKEEFYQIDLNYNNYQSLKEINGLFIHISKIKQYKKLFEKVAHHSKEIVNNFLESIKINFGNIKKEGKKNFHTHDFNILENMFLYLKNLELLVKNKVFKNSLPELKEVKIEENLQKFLDKMNQKLENLQKNFLNNANSVIIEESFNFLQKITKFKSCENLSKQLKLDRICEGLIKSLKRKYNQLKMELIEAIDLEDYKIIFAKLDDCKILFDFDEFFVEKEYHFEGLYLEHDGNFRKLIRDLVLKKMISKD